MKKIFIRWILSGRRASGYWSLSRSRETEYTIFSKHVASVPLVTAIHQCLRPAALISQRPHWLVLIFFFSLLLGSCSDPNNDKIDDFYTVEDIPLPEGLTTEVGGMDFLPDGRLAAVFHRGEVMIYHPQTKEWSLFAEGLHDPLGVQALSNSELLIMQRPELTQVSDLDGDGIADSYMTVTDDYGMSGNYHEFAFGPEPDGEGGYFISLNCASSGA